MSAARKLIFSNGEIYHVFNRGVEKRRIFTDKREHKRAQELLWYYSHEAPQTRYSFYVKLPPAIRETHFSSLIRQRKKITILCYILMPNHFHLLVRQDLDHGIAEFLADFSNSYARYFNTKNKRVGPLFQGNFKAVRIESTEQMLHVSRYIHLNPVSSYLIKLSDVGSYPWSSLGEYLQGRNPSISTPGIVLSHFPSTERYLAFLNDQAEYAQTLEQLKHLAIED